ncbi:hypothetical protein RFI_33513 [Reticulomyxa filosa]|uniref:Uncharacterized protein n=1 Tax=Reticulomyxa filosa TaxID=46433 RepID=X6LQL2_RETFI|nr:hypothetical protein RFI_33513 [Reticulomyxa filosa]|eukprot:ETO03889.1 hypothetical protein RFI_33513 [Reticulomyxa filosa]
MLVCLRSYYHSYYKLKPNEALIIAATMPEQCLYWNFQLNNYWMESLDYRFYPIHVNSDLATYLPSSVEDKAQEKKKKFIICVCHDEVIYRHDLLPTELRSHPATSINWLSTAGHSMGTMCFRWLCTEQFEHPSCTLVQLEVKDQSSDLHEHAATATPAKPSQPANQNENDEKDEDEKVQSLLKQDFTESESSLIDTTSTNTSEKPLEQTTDLVSDENADATTAKTQSKKQGGKKKKKKKSKQRL